MLSDNQHIALAAQENYEAPLLAACLDRLLTEAKGDTNLHSAQVVLKPNLLTTTNASLACTDGRFIVAAARWFVDQGARVQVGDSPAFGSAQGILASLGALRPLRAMNVEVIDFKKTRSLTLPQGVPVRLAQSALDCDLLVGLPKVKAHAQARITLAVKNCFGCVAGMQKPWWHMVHGGTDGIFFDLLSALLAQLPPCLHLVDGICAMHKTGPVHGRAFPLARVLCGANPVAVDTALLYILKIPEQHSPLWLAAHRAGLAGTRLDELILDRELLDSLRVDGFRVPGELSPVRFNPLRFFKNNVKRLLLSVRGK